MTGKRQREESAFDFSYPLGSDAEKKRRTLRFLLSIACERLFPKKCLTGGHAIGNGYWYTFEGDSGAASKADCDKLAAEMKKLRTSATAITSERVKYSDAVAYFEANAQPVALKLLKTRVPFGGYANLSACKIDDKVHYRMRLFELGETTSAAFEDFSIIPYAKGGMVLAKDGSFVNQPATCGAIEELKAWGKCVGVSCTADLSKFEEKDSVQALFVHECESRLEAKIHEVAGDIAARNAKTKIRVVCIAGPTASGKTTFSHKLALALKAHGVSACPLTVDHYYLPLDRQPKYKARKLRSDVDYDSIESMDVELVQEHIMALSDGKKVQTPIYNMKTGYRDEPGKEMELGNQGILIIEGIHALNPEYTEKISAEEKYKIFISPISTMQIDDFNTVKSTDHRLCRRMCRDYLFRGHPATKTLKMWGNVRQGEHTWIFPHQNEANFVFNSVQECDIPILKGRLDMLLRSVPAETDEFEKATHLLTVLDTLPTWQDSSVSSTCLLREFIGGSTFNVH